VASQRREKYPKNVLGVKVQDLWDLGIVPQNREKYPKNLPGEKKLIRRVLILGPIVADLNVIIQNVISFFEKLVRGIFGVLYFI